MALLGRYMLVQVVVVLLLYVQRLLILKQKPACYFFLYSGDRPRKGNAVFFSFSLYHTPVGNSIATPFFLLNSTREYQPRKMLLLLLYSLLLLHPFRYNSHRTDDHERHHRLDPQIQPKSCGTTTYYLCWLPAAIYLHTQSPYVILCIISYLYY